MANETQPLTQEQRELLTLARLLESVDRLMRVTISNEEPGLRAYVHVTHETDQPPRVGTIAEAVTELRARLKPERPTVERIVAAIRAHIGHETTTPARFNETYAELRAVLDDWEAAEQWQAEHDN